MKNKLILSLIFSILLISFVSAGVYSDCSIYGNCFVSKPVSSPLVNYSLVNVNNSQYLQGYQWFNAPYPLALFETYNSTYATWAYNQTYSGSTFNTTYNIWAYNQTYSGSTFNSTYQTLWNNGSYLSTYNSTYQTLWNNGSYLSTYNSSYIDITNSSNTYVPYVGANNNVNLGTNNITGFGSIYTNNSLMFGRASQTLAFIANGLNATINNTGDANLILGIINGNNSLIKTAQSANLIIGDIEGSNSSIYATSNAANLIIGQIYGNNNNIKASSAGGLSMGVIQGTANQNRSIISGSGSISFGILQDTNETITTLNGNGAFAGGYLNKPNGQIASTGSGSFAQGAVLGGAIIATANGAFAQGDIFVISGATNSSIEATARGAFARGHIGASNNYIIASGQGSTAMGLPNMSVSGTGSIGLGQNVNVTGSNSFAFGTSNTLQNIPANNVFWIGANVNSTGNYSAQGVPGFTGTCTILGLTSITVKGGIITGCA
jgi:hypothetical protein